MKQLIIARTGFIARAYLKENNLNVNDYKIVRGMEDLVGRGEDILIVNSYSLHPSQFELLLKYGRGTKVKVYTK